MSIILISALIIRVIADVCFKLAVHNVEFHSIKGSFPMVKKVLSHPAIWLALVVSVLNFWLWCAVLSYYDLSFAYPLFGLCFAAIMLCGKFFFNEALDVNKLIGIGFILLSSLVLIVG